MNRQRPLAHCKPFRERLDILSALLYGAGFCALIVAIMYCIRLFGVTISINPLTAYSVGGLKGAQLSHGNAIINSMRQMFGTLGASALVAIASMASAGGQTDVHGINVAFGVQTVLYAVGLLLAVFFIKDKSTAAQN